MSKRSKNALTHGVYAQEVVLPWEDAQAFDNLHEEIRRDLKPSGYLQEEAVRDIAKEIWRKKRLAITYALPFYKKPMTPELMEAAKGGVAGLAAYLADQSNHSGIRRMTTADLLDEIKAKEAVARMTIPPEDDSNEPGEPPPKKTNGITSDIVEQAYDPATLEKQLKIETMVDNRIRKSHGEIFRTENLCGDVWPEVNRGFAASRSPSNGSVKCITSRIPQGDDRTKWLQPTTKRQEKSQERSV